MRIIALDLFRPSGTGDPTPTSASINGPAMDVSNVYRMSVQYVATGAASAGTVKLQASNDKPTAGAQAPSNPFTPTNWTDIEDSDYTVAGVGNMLIAPLSMSYMYVRVVYTDSSSGSGNGVLVANIKTTNV